MNLTCLCSLLFLFSPIWSEDVKLIKLQEEIATSPTPLKPYAFGYAAGRYPGQIDRTHSEVSDGSGVVEGSYSYVDPRNQIRTVEYVADKSGFHAFTNEHVPDIPVDTPVVAAAKAKHLQRYAAIANVNQVVPNDVVVPVDTVAVQNAKEKHLSLFQNIAEEHARLAAELEVSKKAEEEEQHQQQY